jgi:hypothetical protein
MYSPAPPCCTRRSTAAMANAPYRPEQKSESGTPHFTGAPPGSPVTLMMPLIACMVRSKPPSPERGPCWPNAEIEQYTSFGFSDLKSPWPRPRRSMTPGRLFSITTSAERISALARALSAGSLRSSVTERLLRFRDAKFSL